MSLPENIHTLPTEGIGISWGDGVRVSARPKNLKKCLNLNWNFQMGGEVLEEILSVGEAWMFSGTTQWWSSAQDNTITTYHKLEGLMAEVINGAVYKNPKVLLSQLHHQYDHKILSLKTLFNNWTWTVTSIFAVNLKERYWKEKISKHYWIKLMTHKD